MHMSRVTRSITTALTLTITTAAVALGAVLAQMPDTAPPAQQPAVVQVSADLANEDTTDTACWYEKAESLDTAELICGYRGQMPTGAVDWQEMRPSEVPAGVWYFALRHGAVPCGEGRGECLVVPVGTVFGPSGHEWVATAEGMEPAWVV